MFSKLFGMQIIESPYLKPVPKIQVSNDFKWCTDKARANMNAWLLERFGSEDRILIVDMGTAIVPPRVLAMIKGLSDGR